MDRSEGESERGNHAAASPSRREAARREQVKRDEQALNKSLRRRWETIASCFFKKGDPHETGKKLRRGAVPHR